MIPTAADLIILIFTLAVSLGAVLVSLPLAVVLAHWIEGNQGIFASGVDTLATLPLALPPVAVGLFLLKFISVNSPIGSVFARLDFSVAFTWKGVLLALFVMSFPLTYRPIRSSFETYDHRFSRLSRSLGHSALSTFFRVKIPLNREGIAAGALLGWARALGEFGCTIILAGNIAGETRTLSLAIFHRFQMGHDAGALRLAALTALVTAVLVLGAGYLRRVGG